MWHILGGMAPPLTVLDGWMKSSQLLIFQLHPSVILEILMGLIGSLMLLLLPNGLLLMVHLKIEDYLPHHLRSTSSSFQKALGLVNKENKNYGKDQKLLLIGHKNIDVVASTIYH